MLQFCVFAKTFLVCYILQTHSSVHAPEGIIKFLVKIASRNANETQMQIEDKEGQLIIALNRNCELEVYTWQSAHTESYDHHGAFQDKTRATNRRHNQTKAGGDDILF